MTTEKARLILALLFEVAFLSTTIFVIIYGAVTGKSLWNDFQPYFTGLVGPAGIILGYYFNDISSSFTSTDKTKEL